MKPFPPRSLFVAITLVGAVTAAVCFADPRVVVSAAADGAYTQHKFGAGKTAPESYVVMQGHYFEGGTVDRSIDRMPFRRIAEVFAPELARQQYWPAKDAKTADLLIVVHWGTTTPPVSMLEMRAQTSPVPDISDVVQDQATRTNNALAHGDFAAAMMMSLPHEDYLRLHFAALEQATDDMSNAASTERMLQLLGYARFMGGAMPQVDYGSIGSDLGQERYFIILKAYDLHAATAAARSRAVWTLHLNVGSPGNSFKTALDRMSVAAADFVGRSTDKVEFVRVPLRDGKVEIGPVVSHGEVK